MMIEKKNKTEAIRTTVVPEMKEQIDMIARKYQVSVSEVLRTALEEFIKKELEE